MTQSEPEVGTRRAIQTYGDATFRGAEALPLSEFPAKVEEWDDER